MQEVYSDTVHLRMHYNFYASCNTQWQAKQFKRNDEWFINPIRFKYSYQDKYKLDKYSQRNLMHLIA